MLDPILEIRDLLADNLNAKAAAGDFSFPFVCEEALFIQDDTDNYNLHVGLTVRAEVLQQLTAHSNLSQSTHAVLIQQKLPDNRPQTVRPVFLFTRQLVAHISAQNPIGQIGDYDANLLGAQHAPTWVAEHLKRRNLFTSAIVLDYQAEYDTD